MPYTITNLPSQAKGLTEDQKKKFVDIVNALLKEDMEEGKAIAVALSRAKQPRAYRNQRTNMSEFFENQWVEVFSVGEQTDANGNTREWTDADLNKIVSNYKTNKHEAPLVVGHPKENAPAFGWVEELKTDGKLLFAKFRQLVPEFVDAVKQGMYKKRSISLYPDLTLRHIGFLGAVPPAVKGLADIKFKEQIESIIIEFNELNNEKGDIDMTEEQIKELLKEALKVQKETLDSEFAEQFKKLEEANTKLSDELDTFKEKKANTPNLKPEDKKPEDKDFENLKLNQDEFKEASVKVAIELAELKKDNTFLIAQNKATELKNRVSEYKEFVNELHSNGKIVSDTQSEIVDLMEALHQLGEVNFAEGKENALTKFKEYLNKQPKLVEFEEKANKPKVLDTKSADFQLNKLAEEKVKANEGMSFTEALGQVQEENPELAQRLVVEIDS